MPGETGVTVVTTLVCFLFFAREAAGATSARHSLRPCFRGPKFLQNSGVFTPRECDVASLRVVRVPKQSRIQLPVITGHSRSKNGAASARLCPVIHVFLSGNEDVDGRVKPGHDERGSSDE
jgi:hypothetical protein